MASSPRHISQQDYSKLFLPVHDIPQGTDLLDEFPIIKSKEEFFTMKRCGLDLDKIIRYVSYLYSVESPLVRIYKDNLRQRKEEAAALAGFTDREMKKAESMLFTLDKDMAKLVIRFLIMQNHKTWTRLCSNEEMFYEYQLLILTPLATDKEKDKMQSADMKKKLREESKALEEDIDALYEKIFKDNSDVEETFNNDAEVREHFISPESVARRFESM